MKRRKHRGIRAGENGFLPAGRVCTAIVMHWADLNGRVIGRVVVQAANEADLKGCHLVVRKIFERDGALPRSGADAYRLHNHEIQKKGERERGKKSDGLTAASSDRQS